MPAASETQGILRQNLIDAGCNPETVQQCMALAQTRENVKLMRILACHRRTLLDAVHQNEKRIDCLDYLIYQLDKKTQ